MLGVERVFYIGLFFALAAGVFPLLGLVGVWCGFYVDGQDDDRGRQLVIGSVGTTALATVLWAILLTAP